MKKLFRNLCMPLALSLFLVLSLSAKAETRQLNVTDVGTSSAKISWTAPTAPAAGTYYLGWATNDTDAYNAAVGKTIYTTATNYNIENLTPGTSYVLYVKYTSYDDEHAEAKEVIDPVTKIAKKVVPEPELRDLGKTIFTTRPNTPTNVRQTSFTITYDKVTVAWDYTGNASGYHVVYTDSDGDNYDKFISGAENKSITLNTEDTRYFKVKVQAYVDAVNGERKYGDFSQTFISFAQPQITEVADGFDITIKNGKLKLSWDKVSQATGYEIYVGTKKYDKNYVMMKRVKSKNTTKATISKKFRGKKFSPKKSYYIYVVGYKDKGGKRMRSSSTYVFYYNKGETFMTLRK